MSLSAWAQKRMSAFWKAASSSFAPQASLTSVRWCSCPTVVVIYSIPVLLLLQPFISTILLRGFEAMRSNQHRSIT